MRFMQKLLIIKTSSLGDVIHCLPVINDIRTYFPNVQIDWVAEESFADIPRMHAGVNQIFTVAMRRWKKHIFSQNTWAEISDLKKLIKQNQYDAIIDTQGLLKSALITHQANGTKYGYDKVSIREPIASWFYDKTYTISYQQHAVTRNRTLAAMSLAYAIPTNAPDYGVTAPKCELPLPNQFVIALHGTSRDSKLWPVANWVDLGRELAKKNLDLVLPWATEAELARANHIAKQLANVTMLPKLSIAHIAGVIAKAQAAVGVDTGLSHFAVALNVPTIAIYTDTNPALTGVMGGAVKPAVNLGGIAQIPTVEKVLDTLKVMI